MCYVKQIKTVIKKIYSIYMIPFSETLEDTADFLSRIRRRGKYDSKYMLFTSREVRIGKNCARRLGYRPRP